MSTRVANSLGLVRYAGQEECDLRFSRAVVLQTLGRGTGHRCWRVRSQNVGTSKSDKLMLEHLVGLTVGSPQVAAT
jgi:hypothetical protein